MKTTGDNLKFDLSPPVKRTPLYTDSELMTSILDQLQTLNTNMADCFARIDAIDNAIDVMMSAMPALVDKIVDEMDAAENKMAADREQADIEDAHLRVDEEEAARSELDD